MDRIGLEILITSKASILNFDIDIKFQFSNIGDINIFSIYRPSLARGHAGSQIPHQMRPNMTKRGQTSNFFQGSPPSR